MESVVYAEGEGYRAAPGSTYWCGDDSGTTTCDLGSFAGDQAAEVYGTITPTGVNRGGFDWYTNYIALVSPDSINWGPHGMTIGTWEADVTNVVWRENQAPEVGGIASSPADPTTDDAIVFTVEATDPDEDTLTYAWYIDGTREGPSAPSVTWAKPTAGDHVIKVTVSDGGESVDAFLDLRVSEHVGAGDKDGDGVVDDEDLCPTEWGEDDDGCPPFAASIACAPAKPLPKDSVVCTATVAGLHVGEEPLVRLVPRRRQPAVRRGGERGHGRLPSPAPTTSLWTPSVTPVPPVPATSSMSGKSVRRGRDPTKRRKSIR